MPSTNLKQQLAEYIAAGLKRSSITSCSRWAETYRYMKGLKWSWEEFPWLKEMHDADSELIVGQKAAQLGYTEWALNMTFYNIDVKCTDCLYILPSKDDATDFSSGRFDPALEGSPHLKTIFSDVNNVGLKRAGQATLYVRGSRSRSKLKSIPTGFIVFDEVDEMTQENIPLAMERSSGQSTWQHLMISTPTLPGEGVNGYYETTSQEHFFFKCPHCSRLTELIFPDCLEITAESISDPRLKESFLKCKECKHALQHETKSEWLSTARFVPAYTDRNNRGFTVNQLYSCRRPPWAIGELAIKAQYDPSSEQELWNSKLGLPHIVKGAQIVESDLTQCISTHFTGPVNNGRCITMGIDVGTFLHVVIEEWLIKRSLPGLDINDESIPRMIYEGELDDQTTDFLALDDLMKEYGVHFAVIDRHPAHRSSYSFAKRFWGRVLLCMYGQGINGKYLQLGAEEEKTVTVDRTSWLDLSLGRFRNRTIRLPRNVSEKYRQHLMTPIRRYKENKDGQQVGYYHSGSKADHFAHARNYSEIALPFAAGQGVVKNIKGGVW